MNKATKELRDAILMKVEGKDICSLLNGNVDFDSLKEDVKVVKSFSTNESLRKIELLDEFESWRFLPFENAFYLFEARSKDEFKFRFYYYQHDDEEYTSKGFDSFNELYEFYDSGYDYTDLIEKVIDSLNNYETWGQQSFGSVINKDLNEFINYLYRNLYPHFKEWELEDYHNACKNNVEYAQKRLKTFDLPLDIQRVFYSEENRMRDIVDCVAGLCQENRKLRDALGEEV